MINLIEKNLLKEIADLHGIPEGAYNIRINGKSEGRGQSANITIESKSDGTGIDIYVKPGTVHESVHIPVVISAAGYRETVYNDFHIGENCDVVIIAGFTTKGRAKPVTMGYTPSMWAETPRWSMWRSTTAKGMERVPTS